MVGEGELKVSRCQQAECQSNSGAMETWVVMGTGIDYL
jgi:hypothetical protein